MSLRTVTSPVWRLRWSQGPKGEGPLQAPKGPHLWLAGDHPPFLAPRSPLHASSEKHPRTRENTSKTKATVFDNLTAEDMSHRWSHVLLIRRKSSVSVHTRGNVQSGKPWRWWLPAALSEPVCCRKVESKKKAAKRRHRAERPWSRGTEQVLGTVKCSEVASRKKCPMDNANSNFFVIMRSNSPAAEQTSKPSCSGRPSEWEVRRLWPLFKDKSLRKGAEEKGESGLCRRES